MSELIEQIKKAAEVFKEVEELEKCPPHKWDRDGERCLKCGDKDWMT